jgi:hypothetical protein
MEMKRQNWVGLLPERLSIAMNLLHTHGLAFNEYQTRHLLHTTATIFPFVAYHFRISCGNIHE